MRIAHVMPENWLLEITGALSALGYENRINRIDEGCNVMILWSVTRMNEFEELKKKHDIPFIVYNWDTYYWQHEKPRQNEYDWKRYGELLKEARQVWCPSEATIRTMKEIYGVEGVTIKTYVPLHHLKGVEIRDDRYVLHAMREYPDETDWQLDEACKQLNIPLVRTKNLMSLDDYRNAIAHCSFIVSHYKEASTGGLSLLEAAYLGKPCLVSDSLYNAGKEYIDAVQFEHGNIEDIKDKILVLWSSINHQEPLLTMRILTDMAIDIDNQLKTL